MKFQIADDIKELVEKVVKEEKLNWINIEEIALLRRDEDIKRGNHYVLARTSPLSDKARFVSKKLYVIEFMPLFDTLSNDEKWMIIHHECIHIPEDKKFLVPHDYEEFEIIIDRYTTLNRLSILRNADNRGEIKEERKKITKKIKKVDKELKKDWVEH